MESTLQSAVDALSLGSLYALIALGVGVLFGVMRMVNFAHGEFITVGAYVLLLAGGAAWPVAVLAAVLAVITVSLLAERAAFRPVRSKDPAVLLITSFAVAYLIQNLVVLVAGARPKTLDFGSTLTKAIGIGGIEIPRLAILTLFTTVVLIGMLTYFFRCTRLGVRFRAVAEDTEMARLLGVRVRPIAATAFAISGMLAAVVSVLLVVQGGTVSPAMGLQPVLVALVATVIGGIGSLVGAAVGGLILGVGTVLLQIVLPDALQPYRDAFLFAGVIAIVVFRPAGLFTSDALVERV